MKEKKININRTRVSSAEVEEKRNFDQLMIQLKTPPNIFYSSIGFWGKTGMAGLVILFVVKSITSLFNNFNEDAYDKNITSTQIESGYIEDTKCLKPISAENDIPFEYHEIISGESAEIELSEGTRIVVPENAFNVHSGASIVISTRLFKDKTSAFLAGVPMDYMEDAFESAGMIEIRGEMNGKVVPINPEAPIIVDLNMYKHPYGFDFFALDDKTGEWSLFPAEFKTDLNLPENSNNEDIGELKTELKHIEESISKVKKDFNKQKMPTEESYFIPKNEHLQFNVDFNSNQFPELASFKTILFEALPNQYNYSNVVRTTWDAFRVEKKGRNYTALFTKENMKETLKVRPVLKEREMEKAIRDFENAKKVYFEKQTMLQSELEFLEQKKKEKSMRIEMLSKMKLEKDKLTKNSENDELALINQKRAVQSKLMTATASFSITKWGLFNADKPVAYPQRLRRPIQLVAEHHTMEDIDKAYVFDMKKDVRYTFGSPKKSLEAFGLNDNTTIVMVVYKNGDIGYTETNRKELEENNGKLELTPLSSEEVSEEKIKSILHEGRFSA
jgi:hypothetical protein